MGRLTLRGRSLRFQIVTLLLALLVLTSIAVASVTAFALHGFLQQRLDQELTAAGDRFSVSLEHSNDHDADNDPLDSVSGQAVGTLGARVKDGVVTNAEVVPHDADDTVESAVSAADRAVLASLTTSSHPRTLRLPDLGEYRITVLPGQDGDVLITGLPEHPVDDVIRRLLLIEAAVFGGALVVMGSIGAASVRLSLRPLNRVAATARTVSSLPLSTGTVSLPAPVGVPAPRTEAGEVAEAFNHMLDHVGSALRDRQVSEDRLRYFIADASHELRTPVAVIRSYAEYAERIGDGELPPQVNEALTRISAESDRMGHLVEDLVLLARLDSGRELERDDVDLTRVVLDAVSDARLVGPDHTWRLELSEDEVHVLGDARALHQVVANLLANARTHTPAGTTVRTSLIRLPSGGFRLAISDDGPGIPADVVPRVFDRFVRADTARSGPDGSGLGLSIVEAIVREHDGVVSVVSHPGSTTFSIDLPAYVAAAG